MNVHFLVFVMVSCKLGKSLKQIYREKYVNKCVTTKLHVHKRLSKYSCDGFSQVVNLSTMLNVLREFSESSASHFSESG